MLHRFSRLELLIGPDSLQRLGSASVAVFGIGGVGSFAAEALARSGVGSLRLIDYDDICLTNINRQIHSHSKTIGQAKVDAMAERIRLINPKCQVTSHKTFVDADNCLELLSHPLDYVVDAIDTVSSKLLLVERCRELGIPIVCSMGTGNKLDPTKLQVVDISQTSVDPLARVMRRELRKRGIAKGVKVVYSPEPPLAPQTEVAGCAGNCICPGESGNCTNRRQIPGSTAFVPSAAGLIIASVVVRSLIESAR